MKIIDHLANLVVVKKYLQERVEGGHPPKAEKQLRQALKQMDEDIFLGSLNYLLEAEQAKASVKEIDEAPVVVKAVVDDKSVVVQNVEKADKPKKNGFKRVTTT